MTKNLYRYLSFFLGFIFLVSCRSGQQMPPLSEVEELQAKVPPEVVLQTRYLSIGNHAAIADQAREASQVAHDIMLKGGNIFDAAVAASFVLMVVRPESTGLFGGGFALAYPIKIKKVYAIDFRERAPALASKNMFLDSKGEVIHDASINSPAASAVPGNVRGLEQIYNMYGSQRLSWKVLLEPAIQIAKNGFAVTDYLAKALNDKKEALSAVTKDNPWLVQGKPRRSGEIVRLPALAKTLELISAHGADAFYKGAFARRIVVALKNLKSVNPRLKSIMSEKDLADYEVKMRTPVEAHFKGYDIWSMPPPSSGGIHVLQILKMVEDDVDRNQKLFSFPQIQKVIQASQYAFVDRAKYLADPDFFPVPTADLLNEEKLKNRREKFILDRAVTADEMLKSDEENKTSFHTTHFSILDESGNAVAVTESMNDNLGSGIYLPEFGFFLNNTMDDFSAKSGTQNMFGAVGSDANAIAPGKTPLSSMAPTLVFKLSKPVMSLGAHGGTRIITCVYQTLLRRYAYELSLEDSIGLARYHHQWRPDVIEFDSGRSEFSPTLQAELKARGYELNGDKVHCGTMAAERTDAGFKAVADPNDNSDHALAW